MPFDHCQICGTKGFKTWEAFNHHHQARHNVKPLESQARAFVVDSTEPKQVFKSLDPAEKREIVERIETRIRLNAWDEIRLNPLIGEDINSVEPIWDKERNIL